MSGFSRENQTLGVDRNATLVACSSISLVSMAMVLDAYQYWLSSHFSAVLAKKLFLFLRGSSFTVSIEANNERSKTLQARLGNGP
jgi:hypothetical protein